MRVHLRGGCYELRKPLRFTPADSSTPAKTDWGRIVVPAHDVIFAAHKREVPVLSGGRRITGWSRAKVSGRDAWVVTIPAVRRGAWNFTRLWGNGRRALRPRLPKPTAGRGSAARPPSASPSC